MVVHLRYMVPNERKEIRSRDMPDVGMAKDFGESLINSSNAISFIVIEKLHGNSKQNGIVLYSSYRGMKKTAKKPAKQPKGRRPPDIR